MLLPPCYARLTGPLPNPLHPHHPLVADVSAILSERHRHPLRREPPLGSFPSIGPRSHHHQTRSRVHARARYLRQLTSTYRATIASSLIVSGCNCKANSPCATPRGRTTAHSLSLSVGPSLPLSFSSALSFFVFLWFSRTACVCSSAERWNQV